MYATRWSILYRIVYAFYLLYVNKKKPTMYDMNTNNKIPSAGSVFLLQYPQLFYQKLHKACYCLFNIGIALQI